MLSMTLSFFADDSFPCLGDTPERMCFLLTRAVFMVLLYCIFNWLSINLVVLSCAGCFDWTLSVAGLLAIQGAVCPWAC